MKMVPRRPGFPRRPRSMVALLAAPASLFATAVMAEGLPPIEWRTPSGDALLFYGQIDKGVLSYDDGIDTRSYGLIDNDNSSTRVGIKYTHAFGAWTFENTNEIGYAPYSSSNASILDISPDYDFTNANIRKLDFTFEHAGYGKFSIGQGAMATDGIQEIDLSGTDVIAYSSVADSAAGQILRYADPGLSFEDSLSDVTIGDAFTNYDGPRRVRVRYDTPTFANLTFATAFGRDLLSDNSDVREQNIFDASLSYKNEFTDFQTEAGLGYYWVENDTTTWGGSASGLHTPTGLNATVGFGLGSPEDGPNGQWYYAKLGLLRDYVSWGSTALSVDYYNGEDFLLTGGATTSTSESYGLAVVQSVDFANTEIWFTMRNYDYSDDVASYEDGQAIFGGARFKF